MLAMARTRRTVVARASVLLLLGALAAMPRVSLGQPGGDGGPPDSGGGGDDSGSGGPGIESSGTESLTAVCAENGTDAHYLEFLTGSGSTMVRYGGSETGCPNHVNWDLNPNNARVNPTNESIPAYPMMFADGGTTDLSSTANAIGIMRNGVAMFSSWAQNTVVTYEDTAFFLEYDTFDLCGGHSTIEGTYHYHSTAGCLQEQAMIEAGTSSDEHSALLGWSYDGFPFYGQLGPGGVEMKMCGEDGADETVCLDACSGYEALVPEVDDFTYRYYTSCGFDESFFPFTANCFRGCCPDGVTCSNKVEACGDSPVDGFTSDYVPEASVSLDGQYDADLIIGDDTDFIDSDFFVNCTLYMGASSIAAVTVDSSPAPTVMSSSAAGSSSPTGVDGGTPAPSSTSTEADAVGGTPAPTRSSAAVPSATSDASPAPTVMPTVMPTVAGTSSPSDLDAGVGGGGGADESTPSPSTAAGAIDGTPAPTSTSSAGDGTDETKETDTDGASTSASGLTFTIAATMIAGAAATLLHSL